MAELLHSAARKIVDDPIFLNIIETKLKAIMKDGKIDKKDIPDVTILVVYCTNNLKKFNVTYDELGQVLEETINYLLNHFKVIPDESVEEFKLMVHSMVELTLLQPKVKSCLTNIWNKIFCC
jgi:hypothetical protein